MVFSILAARRRLICPAGALVALLGALGTPASIALAQDALLEAELRAFRIMVDSDPFTSDEDDPIGVDAHTASLQNLRLPTPEERARVEVPPREGAVLTAIPGVHEVEHRIEIRLRAGFAFGRDELVFESSASRPGEVMETLRVPEGAVLAGLRVCLIANEEARCRSGVPSRDELGIYDDIVRDIRTGAEVLLPTAHIAAEAGGVFRLRAAPVPPRHAAKLQVFVSWTIQTPVRGGTIELTLPPRPDDARVVRPELRVDAVDLVAPSIDGRPAEHPVLLANYDEPLRVRAALPLTASPRAEVLRVSCAAGLCEHARAVGGRPRISSDNIVIAIDTSPSTVNGARGRIAPAVRAIVRALPPTSRVRIIPFAARAGASAHWLAPQEVDLDALDAVPYRELGISTRFESVLERISREERPTRLMVVGDGGVSVAPSTHETLRAAEEAGISLFSVNVADRPTTSRLVRLLGDDRVLDVGASADALARGRDAEAFLRMVSGVLSEDERASIGGHGDLTRTLRSGEELRWRGPIERASLPSETLRLEPDEARAVAAFFEPATTWIAVDARDSNRVAACRARGPFRTFSAVGTLEHPVALSHRRHCTGSVEESPESREDTGAATEDTGAATEDTGVATEDTGAATEDTGATTEDTSATTEDTGAAGARGSAHPSYAPEPPRSMVPPQSILQTLRRRVIPRARGCFRSDRRGRAAYQTRAAYAIVLADREVESLEVEGQLSSELRACLEEAISDLEIPPFDGRLRIRWPLYTAPSLPAPVIELRTEVADAIDEVLPDSRGSTD